jgi:hypothetical protein
MIGSKALEALLAIASELQRQNDMKEWVLLKVYPFPPSTSKAKRHAELEKKLWQERK